MVAKVLFFDTCVMLKLFIDEDGTRIMKWLTSSQFKVTKRLYFVINKKVCLEFEDKIKNFAKDGKITEKKANQVIFIFNKYYKNKYFKVIGQKIISNSRNETSIDQINLDLSLKKGKNDWDGFIYQSMVNALAYLGGDSTPILVTCDKKFANKVKKRGYRVINPIEKMMMKKTKIILKKF